MLPTFVVDSTTAIPAIDRQAYAGTTFLLYILLFFHLAIFLERKFTFFFNINFQILNIPFCEYNNNYYNFNTFFFFAY